MPHWSSKRPGIPQIETRIWTRNRESGGRNHPFSAGYCPHLVVKGQELMLGVRALAITQSKLENQVFPGEDAVVVWALMYFCAEFRYEALVRNATFEIREGPQRVIGTGIVTSDFEF